MTENATGSSLRQIDSTTRSSSLKRVGISDSSYGAFILDMGDLELGMEDWDNRHGGFGTAGMDDLDSRRGDLGQREWGIWDSRYGEFGTAGTEHLNMGD